MADEAVSPVSKIFDGLGVVSAALREPAPLTCRVLSRTTERGAGGGRWGCWGQGEGHGVRQGRRYGRNWGRRGQEQCGREDRAGGGRSGEVRWEEAWAEMLGRSCTEIASAYC
jgi:hypothetical protein